MSISFPEIRVGDPIRHERLSVFPLFGEPVRKVNYALSDEAIDRGNLTVEEVSEAGSVPNLSVENRGDIRVLFLEGEELVGAKQNRILNTSLLIAAHTKSKIPVSCVEAGRWRYKSRHFGSAGTHSPTKLRHVLKASVAHSLKASLGHRSDQGEVWDEVARQQTALGAASPTSAMSDTFEAYGKRLEEFREKMRYVDGAVGAAVVVAGKVVAVDLFDKATTCGKVWNRMLSGAMLDALEAGSDDKHAEAADVQRVLERLEGLSWSPADPVGEGEEYRAETSTGDHASALVLDNVVVHGSLVCAS